MKNKQKIKNYKGQFAKFHNYIKQYFIEKNNAKFNFMVVLQVKILHLGLKHLKIFRKIEFSLNAT